MPEISYTRVSPFAVISAAAGIATCLSLLVPPLGLLSIIGVVSGGVALIAIRRYEVGGARLTRLGLMTSVIFGIAGPLWQFVAFRLEAPAGYLRLDFGEVTREQSRESLEQYVEENVCLKGFALYEKSRGPVGEFCLSVDGDNVYVKNPIIVELPPGQTWKWDDKGIAVSGTLVRSRGPVRADKSYPKFKLTNAVIRRSLTGVGHRGGRGC